MARLDSDSRIVRVECESLITALYGFSLKCPRPGRLLLAVLLFASLSQGCTRDESADNQPTPELAHAPATSLPMPPITANAEIGWQTSDNKRARLADYNGRILVLDFYATWCAPCRQSIPGLIALQQRFADAGLQVVGLNVGGPDDRVKVDAFQRELSIQYPLGFPDRSLTDLFLSDNQTIPQTFVFGRSGQLIKRFIGYQSSTGAELEKVVQQEITSR